MLRGRIDFRTMGFCVVAVLALQLLNAARAAQSVPDPFGYPRVSQTDMQWWKDAKFGMFIHWGPVCQTGKEISWSRAANRPGLEGTWLAWPRYQIYGHEPTPVEVYDNLYKTFNPVDFDAKKIVSVAKAAGMKYIVLISKHHDGFSMFDSKLTDYKITNTPIKRDLAKELVDACHEAGMKMGFYYSQPDWHHPDYMTANHARYIEYFHGQVRELCTNYGKVDIFWFDGIMGKAKNWDSEKLYRMIHKLQPGIIINDRADVPGDFGTPEQKVGEWQIHKPWESCMTLTRYQWTWRPNDEIRSAKECIQILVSCVGGGGNLLMNIGPTPKGAIEPAQIVRLEEIGDWVKKYGYSVYGTRGGPFIASKRAVSTCKGDTVYLHLLKWFDDNEKITLEPIERNILSSRTLTGGTVSVKQMDKGIEITVPKSARNEIDTIVELKLDGPVAGIYPKSGLEWHSGSVACRKYTTQSSTFANELNNDYHTAAKAVDDDMDTMWLCEPGSKSAWMALDLDKLTTIDRAFIHAANDCVKQFELQAKANESDEWSTFAEGTTIGPNFRMEFPTVTARFVRLNILQSVDTPAFWEFQLFSPGK